MIAILGAGPCGLSAAYHLRSAGREDFVLLERSASAGGLCKSLPLASGGDVDCGGHAFFTKEHEFQALMDKHNGDQLVWQPRRALVAHKGCLVRYPLQANLAELKSQIARKYRDDFQHRPDHDASSDEMVPWLLSQFGNSLCEDFFFPYTEKLWAHPLSQLTATSNADRIPTLTDTEMRDGAVRQEGRQSISFRRYPNATIGVPRSGRFWDLFGWLEESVADKLRFSTSVKSIDLKSRRLTVANSGETPIGYRHLVSTLPLDRLVSLSIDSDTPSQSEREVLDHAQQLRYCSLHLVTLTTPATNLLTDGLRIYCADLEVPFHKLVIQPLTLRPGVFAIQAEVTFSDFKEVVTKTLVKDVIDAMVRLQIVASDDELKFERLDTIQRAYPVITTRGNAARNAILDWFRQRGVHGCGRFGSWSYINSDIAWLMGKTVASEITASSAAKENRDDA